MQVDSWVRNNTNFIFDKPGRWMRGRVSSGETLWSKMHGTNAWPLCWNPSGLFQIHEIHPFLLSSPPLCCLFADKWYWMKRSTFFVIWVIATSSNYASCRQFMRKIKRVLKYHRQERFDYYNFLRSRDVFIPSMTSQTLYHQTSHGATRRGRDSKKAPNQVLSEAIKSKPLVWFKKCF